MPLIKLRKVERCLTPFRGPDTFQRPAQIVRTIYAELDADIAPQKLLPILRDPHQVEFDVKAAYVLFLGSAPFPQTYCKWSPEGEGFSIPGMDIKRETTSYPLFPIESESNAIVFAASTNCWDGSSGGCSD